MLVLVPKWWASLGNCGPACLPPDEGEAGHPRPASGGRYLSVPTPGLWAAKGPNLEKGQSFDVKHSPNLLPGSVIKVMRIAVM
ncbi:hypothetical protein VPNG_07588 [Cytospora leucostoma]|uniref:Uncharacterized protein n=1 Tax=Cytospora leucostoma TaxID=1230097 RepID=A0A423WDJ1_9PEZI|nr:hypothetical protein VPNG_07588 [Cytospora leucostoma]